MGYTGFYGCGYPVCCFVGVFLLVPSVVAVILLWNGGWLAPEERTGCASAGTDRVEIIPLEPDQRSDLRREAPSVADLFFAPSLGAFYRLLTPFFFPLLSKSSDTSR